MRIRSIKPEFWRSEDVVRLPREVRLLFVGLWSYVDDNAVGRDDLSAMVADLFAHDMMADPKGTISFVSSGLDLLVERRLVIRYEAEGRRLIFVPGFDRHQRINRPSEPRFPRPPEEIAEPSLIPRGALTEPSVSPPDARAVEQGSRGAGEQGSRVERAKRARALPDAWTPDDVLRQWTARVAPSVAVEEELERFRDYWLGTGRAMKDWNAVWRNWVRRSHDTNVRQGWRPRLDDGDEWSYR